MSQGTNGTHFWGRNHIPSMTSDRMDFPLLRYKWIAYLKLRWKRRGVTDEGKEDGGEYVRMELHSWMDGDEQFVCLVVVLCR